MGVIHGYGCKNQGLISEKLFCCLRLITWCLSQVLDTCCLLKEVWLGLRFHDFGNYQTKIILNSSIPIPPLQIKWLLAILPWTTNKPMQQSNPDHVNDALNEYSNRGTEKLDSQRAQSSAKTSKWDFSQEEPTKYLFCMLWATKSLPAPHTTLQSCSKGQIPQT